MKHYSQQQLASWSAHPDKDDFIYWGKQFYDCMIELERIAAIMRQVRQGFSIEAVKMEVKAEGQHISQKTALVTIQDFYKLKAAEIADTLTSLADNSGIDDFWQRMQEATGASYGDLNKKA
jgi:hypothetical protein